MLLRESSSVVSKTQLMSWREPPFIKTHADTPARVFRWSMRDWYLAWPRKIFDWYSLLELLNSGREWLVMFAIRSNILSLLNLENHINIIKYVHLCVRDLIIEVYAGGYNFHWIILGTDYWHAVCTHNAYLCMWDRSGCTYYNI